MSTHLKISLALLGLAYLVPSAAADDLGGAREPAILLIEENGRPLFKVEGLTDEMLDEVRGDNRTADEWQAIFSVRIAGLADDQPSLLGDYRADDDALLFAPRFALRQGRTYEARLDSTKMRNTPKGWKQQLVKRFEIGRSDVSKQPTELLAIYPTRKVLPENQLKFYLHFSRPMSRGEAYRHIHLLDENNQEVEFAFLELPQELWDPELTRFTLFFDPGRIKRGLKPREEFGPSIIEDKSYTLMIDETWPDADGQALKQSERKEFQVTAPDDVQPDPSRWELRSPATATTSPLIAQFDEPLDHAMLHRVLQVCDSSGARVSGKMETSDEETLWRFIPDKPWRGGEYKLVIDTRLEDLAGNSIARPFEVDLFDTVQQTVPSETVRLPFEVR